MNFDGCLGFVKRMMLEMYQEWCHLACCFADSIQPESHSLSSTLELSHQSYCLKDQAPADLKHCRGTEECCHEQNYLKEKESNEIQIGTLIRWSYRGEVII
ncbi:hypothetical protein L6164_002348 [Bauhinia variegata]|uniref:Uncharacterized protein n=1 Tax=Bauhinia variegata TaxID=167791 RepID=A0ACB9PZF2_BAUVA|nr:hypothetical protein L6164_002348 [Bauhinia variegata]